MADTKQAKPVEQKKDEKAESGDAEKKKEPKTEEDLVFFNLSMIRKLFLVT